MDPRVYLGKLPVTGYGGGEGTGHEMRQEEPQGTAGTGSALPHPPHSISATASHPGL